MWCRLWRSRDANRDQRRIGGGRFGPAGGAALAEDLGGIAGRAAIGRHQHFVILALDRAAGGAIRPDHSDTRAGRPSRPCRAGRPSGPLRTCRPSRARGTHCANIALWTGRALLALWSFTARRQTAGEPHQQYRCECPLPCTHFPVLPNCFEKQRTAPLSSRRCLRRGTCTRRSNRTSARKEITGGAIGNRRACARYDAVWSRAFGWRTILI